MGAYYYAAGRKVQLEDDDDHVAIDQKAAERAGLRAELESATQEGARPASGVVVVDRASMGKGAIASLRDAGALRPVYRHDRAMVVPLPEVRVEFDTPQQRRSVMELLKGSQLPPHDVAESSEDRLVVRPTSGDGDDALTLANTIYERARPAASSVRFVQFVPKPSLR